MAIDITQHSIILGTPEDAFRIVADIHAYPDFLPWCLDARILQATEDSFVADLTIGYKAFRHTYRSHVRCTPFSCIEVKGQEGPLESLTTLWHFEPYGDLQTLITLHITFKLRSFLLERALARVIEGGTHRITQAFRERAHALVSQRSPEGSAC